MLSLPKNPNLLEHVSFTDLLLAIFHLSEELAARDTLDGLPQSDYEHLAGDIKRAYTLLIREWLAYMMHLKDNPMAVQLAHRMAMESTLITSNMVEATEFPHLAHKYNVAAVPKTVINETIEFEGALPEQDFLKYVLEAGK